MLIRRIAVLSALSSFLAVGQRVGPRIHSAEAEENLKQAARRDLPSLRLRLPMPLEHRLPALTAEDVQRTVARLDAASPKLGGLHRTLAAEALDGGRWQELAAGKRVWRFALHSPSAEGLRVRFSRFDVGGGRVWVHDGTEDEARIFGPYQDRGIHADGEFWSDVVVGDTIVVEFEPEVGSEPLNQPPFEVAEMSHLLEGALPASERKSANSKSASASCNLDVTCFPEWAETARSVGHIVFERQGSTFVCSGTLLNTRTGGGPPLFLTADHCIADDTTARSVQAFWLYQSDACNGTPRARRDSPRSLGARYLAGTPMTSGDVTLIQLNEVPNGIQFSGWNADPLPDGTSVTGIHHPSGDPKKISFGVSQGARVRPGLNGETFVAAAWGQGITEGGSSGSGLFSSPGVLVGTLSHGPKADTPEGYCALRPMVDNYGRFTAAYPVLRSFLDGRASGTPPPPPPPSGGGPVSLTSGQARNFSFDAIQNATLFSGSNAFRIDVPEGATRLEVRLTTATPNVDVDLFVRFGSEPEVSGGRVTFDYSSESATGNELVAVTSQSTPPLRAGTYYISLGVFTTGVPVNGTVTATVTTPTAPPPPSGSRSLTSGVPQNFTIGPVTGGTLFAGTSGYTVTVPQGATRLEIRLTTSTPGADVDLYARFGSDVAVQNQGVVADHKSEGAAGDESIVITSSSSPPLRPGTYFIGLGLFTSNVTANGSLVATVTTNGGGTTPGGSGTTLTSGTPHSFSLDAVANATLFRAGAGYQITVPQGATRLEVRLQTATPNVDIDLFVRRGSDPSIGEDGRLVADFRSEGPSGDELITITPSSSPALQPGTYFIALGLFTRNTPANGTITATVATGSQPPPSTGGGELTSGRAMNFSLPASEFARLFNEEFSFRIQVPEGATRLDVRLNTATPNADVDLFVRHAADSQVQEGRVVADYSSEGPTGSETISVTAGSSPALRPGTYFVSLANFTTNLAVNGTVTATVTTGGGGDTTPRPNAPTVLTSGTSAKFRLPAGDSAALYNGVYSYQITVPEGASRLDVQLATDVPSIDVDLFVRYGSDTTIDSGEVIADYASTSPLGTERISITAGSVPALRPGTYYISLALYTTNAVATGSVTATVERATITPPASNTRTLTSGVATPFSLPVVNQPTYFSGDYGFRINVPPDSERLEIAVRTEPSNVDVDLAVRYGAEPTPILADHRAVSDTGNETIIIHRLSVPPLRVGTYFIALPVYTTGVPARGTITATVFAIPKSGEMSWKKGGVSELERKPLAIAEPIGIDWKRGPADLTKSNGVAKSKPVARRVGE